MLAHTVQDEDRSVIIVEREDILQSNVKIKPRARPLVVNIVASPDTQRRSAVRSSETSSSQRAKAKEHCRRRAKEKMIEQDEAKGYKPIPLRKHQLRRTWWRTAIRRACGSSC